MDICDKLGKVLLPIINMNNEIIEHYPRFKNLSGITTGYGLYGDRYIFVISNYVFLQRYSGHESVVYGKKTNKGVDWCFSCTHKLTQLKSLVLDNNPSNITDQQIEEIIRI